MGKGFKDLVVWQKAMELVRETYQITKNSPKKRHMLYQTR